MAKSGFPDNKPKFEPNILRLEYENEQLRKELRIARESLRSLADVENALSAERQLRLEAVYAREKRSLNLSLPKDDSDLERILSIEHLTSPDMLRDDINLDTVKAIALGCELVVTGMRRGLFVINSAFEFKPEYNQRPIALAKEAAALGYFVIFVAWQWDQGEKLKHRGRIFSGSILEIGRFDALSLIERVSAYNLSQEMFFVLTIPSDDFVTLIPRFQTLGFTTIYDVMDDWEGFHSAGQASWWTKELEDRSIQIVDRVSVVSPVLREKFEYLRSDIRTIANGLRNVSADEMFISSREENKNRSIVVGYFGHLTDAWFDWPGLFELAGRNNKIDIQVIGYGEPDWVRQRLKDFKNITLVGFVPADSLSEHVCKWHIGIIPFKSTKLVQAVDPIKIYEYIYFGLPVVSTGMPHLEKYPETHAISSIADANEICIDVYSRVVSRDLNYTEMATFASNSTWRVRLQEMLS